LNEAKLAPHSSYIQNFSLAHHKRELLPWLAFGLCQKWSFSSANPNKSLNGIVSGKSKSDGTDVSFPSIRKLGIKTYENPLESRELTTNYNKIENCCDTSLFPHIVLAGGKSKATAKEIEEKQKELNELKKELAENREERKVVDEENTRDGDTDSPYEKNSAEELEHWDEYIKKGEQAILEILQWLNN